MTTDPVSGVTPSRSQCPLWYELLPATFQAFEHEPTKGFSPSQKYFFDFPYLVLDIILSSWEN